MRPTKLRVLIVLVAAVVGLSPVAAQAQPTAADWNVMFDDLHDRYFGAGFEPEYLLEAVHHSMGEDFHTPPGATYAISYQNMLLELVFALYDLKLPSLRPVVVPDYAVDGRPAMFYWDVDNPYSGGQDLKYIYWSDRYYYATLNDSVGAYYLEQVGHYLNWTRCKTAKAPFGQNGRSCPTSHGGNPGARFRDFILGVAPSATMEEARDFRRLAHPRAQLTSEPYFLGTIDGDGQSGVTPIYIVDDPLHDRYTQRAVRNLLAADGQAGSLFRFLEEEHGIEVPSFLYRGESNNPTIDFVIQNERLTRVDYWLPANPSASGLKADQFWYTVAQALVDTIHGPLAGSDRCEVDLPNYGGWPVDHVWLEYGYGGFAVNQSEQCLHRDTVAHTLAGLLVHQHEFDPDDVDLMNRLFDEVYDRHSGALDHVSRVACGTWAHLWPTEACRPEASVQTKNISSTEVVILNETQGFEGSCEPETLGDYEDKQCWGQPQDDGELCVKYEWDDISGVWVEKTASCDDYHRIACQKAYDEDASSASADVLFDTAQIELTEDSYRLDFADEACAKEFGRGEEYFAGDTRKYVWSGAWLPAQPPEDSWILALGAVGSGGGKCGAGAKRKCSDGAATVDDGGSEATADRKRRKISIRFAIRFRLAASPTVTQTTRAQDILRVHAINVGSGSCHLVQCLGYEPGNTEPASVENALLDCGTIPRRHNQALDTAGVVDYLRASEFYDHGKPLIVSSSHPDRDHFSHIPGILGAGGWADQDLHFLLGGWPEEFVGAYQNPRQATQSTSLVRVGRDVSRRRMNTLLADPAGRRFVNGREVRSTSVVDDLIAATKASPAAAEPLVQFQRCGGLPLKLVDVNPAPTAGVPVSSNAYRPIRRNRSGSVINAPLTIQYPLPGGTATSRLVHFVLPGDALGYTEEQALPKMAAEWSVPWNWTVLMASHHGSDHNDSNSADWIASLQPTATFYSAGLRPYNHPHQPVVEAYNAAITRDTALHQVTSGIQGGGRATLDTSRAHFSTIDSGSLYFEVVLPMDQHRNYVEDQVTYEVVRLGLGNPAN